VRSKVSVVSAFVSGSVLSAGNWAIWAFGKFRNIARQRHFCVLYLLLLTRKVQNEYKTKENHQKLCMYWYICIHEYIYILRENAASAIINYV